MTIRCVVFDFDGTLLRSNRIKRQSLYDCVEEIAGAAEILDAMHRDGLPGDRYDIFRELCRRLGRRLPEDADRLATAYGELCRERLIACEPVPGAMQSLAALSKASMVLYIASATPEKDLRLVVRDRGIAHFFADVLGRPTGKADHLRRVLEKHGLSPPELLVVGDGSDDEAAAAAVRCRFVAVLDDPVSPPAVADAFLQDLQTLPVLVRTLSEMAEAGRGEVRTKPPAPVGR